MVVMTMIMWFNLGISFGKEATSQKAPTFNTAMTPTVINPSDVMNPTVIFSPGDTVYGVTPIDLTNTAATNTAAPLRRQQSSNQL